MQKIPPPLECLPMTSMNQLKRVILCAVWMASTSSFVLAADGSVPLLVNEVSIGANELDNLVAAFVAQGSTDGEELRAKLKEELITREVVAQESIKLGLDLQPDIAAALSNSRRDILVNAFQSAFAERHPIAEADIETEYARQREEAGVTEFRVRHVLVKSEKEASAIVAALAKGEKFDILARKYSMDSTTRALGGDLGWQLPMALNRTLRVNVVKVGKGQNSIPIESPFGWHILRVDETRPYAFPTYDKMRAVIVEKMQSAAALQAITDLRKAATVR